MGYGIFIFIWIWSLVCGTSISILWLSIFILKVKEHLCPVSLDLGLWRMLEVPDWGLSF